MAITWGYLRVSTDDQGAGLAAQRQAVLSAGVDERHLRIDEGISGKTLERPALRALLAEMQRGDTLVVAKLDRLGRSVYGVLGLFQELDRAGVDVRVLHEALDTTTPAGKMMRNLLLTFAEFERELISSRTKAALAEIKRTGIGKSGAPVTLGRPTALTDDQVVAIKGRLMAGEGISKLSREYRVSRQTIYKLTGLRRLYVAKGGDYATQ